jgi:hypothetical protein
MRLGAREADVGEQTSLTTVPGINPIEIDTPTREKSAQSEDLMTPGLYVEADRAGH